MILPNPEAMEQVFSNPLIMTKIIGHLLDGGVMVTPKKLGLFTKRWCDIIFSNKTPQHCLNLLNEKIKYDDDDVENCQLSHALRICSFLNFQDFEITLTLPKKFSTFAQVLNNNEKLFSNGKLKTLRITGSGIEMEIAKKYFVGSDIEQFMNALLSMNNMEKVVFAKSGIPLWIIPELRREITQYSKRLRTQHFQKVVELVKENKFNRINRQLPPQYKIKPSTVFSLSGVHFVLDIYHKFYITTLHCKKFLKP